MNNENAPKKKEKWHLLIGLGFILSLFSRSSDHILAFLIGITGVVLIVWGSVLYAKKKGYSGAVGLLGLLWIFGIAILLALPDKTKR